MRSDHGRETWRFSFNFKHLRGQSHNSKWFHMLSSSCRTTCWREKITSLKGTFSVTRRYKGVWHNDDECLLRHMLEQSPWSVTLRKKKKYKSTYLRTVMCLQAFLAALSWANSKCEYVRSRRQRSVFQRANLGYRLWQLLRAKDEFCSYFLSFTFITDFIRDDSN